MVTENVKTSGYLYLTSAGSGEAQRKGGKGFSDAIEKAENSYQSVKKQPAKQKNEKISETSRSAKKEAMEKTASNASRKQEITGKEKTSAKELQEEENVSSKEMITGQTEELSDKNAEEAVSVLVAQMIQQVKETLCEKLDVSMEELSNSLEELGLNIKDLQDNQNLLKLITQVKELGGVQEILTNPNLAKSFKELSAEINQLFTMEELQDQNLTDRELQTDTKTIQPMQAETDNSHKGSEHQEKGMSFQERTSSDLQMQNLQNPQQVFTDHIESALNERVDAATSRSIVNQVVEQVQVQMKSDMTSIEMQLYPQHLGKISVQIAAKNGVLTAQISAETEAAKAALESQIATLKETLDNQGLKVDSVEVTVASRGFDQNADAGNGQQEQSSRGRRTRKEAVDELLADPDPQEDDVRETLGNTVSYTA